eukprot:1161241-Pelagomonas_calceolata.AAC.4
MWVAQKGLDWQQAMLCCLPVSLLLCSLDLGRPCASPACCLDVCCCAVCVDRTLSSGKFWLSFEAAAVADVCMAPALPLVLTYAGGVSDAYSEFQSEAGPQTKWVTIKQATRKGRGSNERGVLLSLQHATVAR